MKIYTRTGDDGETGLFGGARVSKASLRVEAYGTVDETNATIGRARVWINASGSAAVELDAVLAQIQSDLFTIGAELATVAHKDAAAALKMQLIDDADCTRLERAIDDAEAGLAPLKHFVLPGGTIAASELHVARCVARRAERLVVELREHEPVRREVIIYLNRLSDLLFTLARRANHLAAVADVPWVPNRRAGKD
jgi:cob(I)alamin adenosyltransferase